MTTQSDSNMSYKDDIISYTLLIISLGLWGLLIAGAIGIW